MANDNVPDAVRPQQTPELHIEIWLDHWARYTGTAAQLEAEGLIPEGFKWPRAASTTEWRVGGLTYRLSRTRPDGHKGRMGTWLELDNWRVWVGVVGRGLDWQSRRSLERRAKELRDDAYRLTPAGRGKWNTEWNQYCAARNDDDFQAFKAKVPGLIPPKRGRKPKTQATGTPEQSA